MTTMEDPKPSQNKFSELLRTNKLAILLEIAVVFVPLYVILIVSDRLGGNDFIPLGGDLVLAGAPLVYLGMILALVAVWVVSKMRGSSWGEFGLARPKNWVRTILMGIGMTVVFIVAATLLSQLIKLIFQTPEADLSRFAPLQGNLPNLIINVVALWFTAGFVEEFLWCGYLMNRLFDLQGKNTKLAWTISLVVSAIIFGLGHTYQGLGGVIKITAMGLLLGGGFLVVRRNLWPLIIVHVVIDTISMIQHYFGG
ncbi:MAG: CPBP family intramembrane metalloprotease [Anaerolineaceae bacterium]|nr:CPBP family intramembrane metalloprotease [Anaerolineaceae bacterium]